MHPPVMLESSSLTEEPVKNLRYSGKDSLERSNGRNSMNDRGVYHFSSEFTISSTKDAIAWIMDFNHSEERPEVLNLMISSYGGDLFAGFGLVDAIRGSSIPVSTIGLGVVSSAALVVFIAGEQGMRYITPNTFVLSHQWSWGRMGKEHELVAATKAYDLISQRMVDHYKKCTGLSEKKIRKYLLPAHDIWMGADEALEFNLADKIKDIK